MIFHSARSRLLFALLPAAVTLVIVALALTTFRTLVRANGAVDHTRQVLGQGDMLLFQLAAAEAAQRGYLVTGDTTFLAPARASRERAGNALAQLRRLTADNPRQGPRLDSMSVVLSERFAVLDSGSALRRAGRLDSLSARPLLLLGRARMERLRELGDEVLIEEQQLLDQRESVAGAKVSTLTIVLLVGGALAVVIAVLVNLFLTRVITEGEQMARELGAQLGDLTAARRALAQQQQQRPNAGA